MNHLDDDPHGLEEPTEEPEEHPPSAPAVVLIQARAQDATDTELVTFDFVETFMDVTDELFKHPSTTQVSRDVDQPVSDLMINMTEDGLGGRLDPQLLSLYKLGNGFKLQWSWLDRGEQRFGGEVRLVDFDRLFGHWFDSIWPTDDSMESEDFLWHLRGFDVPSSPDAIWGTIWFAPDADPLTGFEQHIYAYHPDHGALPMHMNLVDYIFCALEARGMPGWQLLFTDYDFGADPWDVGPPTWIDSLALLFPEADIDFFTNQLGARPANEEE